MAIITKIKLPNETSPRDIKDKNALHLSDSQAGNLLSIDSVPTNNSTNLITSGGVKAALDAISANAGVYRIAEEEW